jgi:hypothetical protein
MWSLFCGCGLLPVNRKPHRISLDGTMTASQTIASRKPYTPTAWEAEFLRVFRLPRERFNRSGAPSPTTTEDLSEK